MSATEIIKGSVWEDGGATILARVTGNAGAAITQASLTSITCKVFDLDGTTPDTAITTPTITVSTAVYDTLQTDARWTVDSTGYNFIDALAATNFPTGDHLYRVEYKFTPTSGAVFFVVAELYAKNVRTS